jgi:choline/glycine/proline betaine transport protein
MSASSDWRQVLAAFLRQQNIRQQADRSSITQWQRVADHCLDAVAMPALEALKQELEGHGWRVTITRGYRRAVMSVEYDDGEEIRYTVRVHVTTHGARAYPELGLRDWTGERQYTADSRFRSGAQDYNAADITSDEIINHFVTEYTGHFRNR